MTVSRLAQLLAVLCLSVWLSAPSLFAQDANDSATRGRPLQIESPFSSPVGPFGLPDSAIPTPHVDPIGCSTLAPCGGTEPTPVPEFQTFLPNTSGSSVEQPAPADVPPGPPPDLSTVLNYIAGAVIVIAVGLKVYWYVSDRRKGLAK